MTVIPLFPLNLVLFPASKLPLYIFEERYKKMINVCMDEQSSFGINFFSDNHLYPTGCFAKVDQLVSRTEKGEMNIITKGIGRYEILNYELSEHGFYNGTVNLITDFNSDFDKEKMNTTVSLYNSLVEIVYKGSVKKIDLSEIKWYNENRSVSFVMAEKCGLSLLERQSLLEMNEEDTRLNYILKYLEEVMPKLKEADKISNIIKGDGYIQQ